MQHWKIKSIIGYKIFGVGVARRRHLSLRKTFWFTDINNVAVLVPSKIRWFTLHQLIWFTSTKNTEG